MTGYLQIVTTTDTKDRASAIGRALLDRRLAGCVQVAGPITSSYWWDGRIETAEEWYCVIKTSADRYPEVERAIRAAHSYAEPEILAFAVAEGSRSYLDWLAASMKG
jgi:periplasmic divalent cation tolerance protein